MHLASLRLRLGPRVATALIVGGFALMAASCGSRTGLFGPELVPLDRDAMAVVDADDGEAGRVRCIPGRFTLELALTQLMFVLDRSGSMKFTLDGRSDQSVEREEWRWTILQNALRKTITAFDQQIAMGAKFFPETLANDNATSAERSCRTDTDVGLLPARGNASKIIDAFDLSEPRGGTPTSEAMRIASEFLTNQRSVARTLVLATDGAPNCNGTDDIDPATCVCTSLVDCSATPERGRYSCLDDTRTIETIRRISEVQKIPVYVIGIGGLERPEFLQVLDEMAVAGGRPRPTTPRHYSAQSEDDLTEALGTIRDSAAKCTYVTPSAPDEADRITVTIDGTTIRRDETETNGWNWVDKSFGWLAFFGDACLAAQNAATASSVNADIACDE